VAQLLSLVIVADRELLAVVSIRPADGTTTNDCSPFRMLILHTSINTLVKHRQSCPNYTHNAANDVN